MNENEYEQADRTDKHECGSSFKMRRYEPEKSPSRSGVGRGTVFHNLRIGRIKEIVKPLKLEQVDFVEPLNTE